EQKLLGGLNENSKRILQELERLEIPTDQEKEMFWMLLEDFVNHFDIITTCKIHENFSYNSLELNPTQYDDAWKASLIKMEIEKDGLVYLTLHQPMARHYVKEDYEYLYTKI